MNISAIFRTFFISFVLSFLFPYAIFAQTYEHETDESNILAVGDVVVLKSGNGNTYLIDNNGSFGTSGDCNSKNAWWNVTANGFQNIETGKYILCTPTNGGLGNGSASYSLSLDNGTPIAVTGTNWYVGSATNWFGASTTYFRPNNTGTTGVAYNNSNAVKAYKRTGFQLVFVHSKGVTEAPFTHEGRQQTHEITEVLYANIGDEKSLKAQVSDLEIYEGNNGWHYMCGFYRWSDFANDGNVGENLICDDGHKGNYTSTTNNKGFYLTKNTEPGRFTYKMDGNVRKVVCEVSAYADYQSSYDFDSNVSTFVEPTLSYRQIFEIRPASEMADKLDDCTNKPLEEYNIIAPAGKAINIGPKYAWSGNDAKIVNYYYTNQGNIVHAQNCVWTKNRASHTAGTVLDNRVISVTAPSAGQTDIYELKTSTGLIIARFNIETLASSAIGPSTTAPNLISEEELAEKYELSVALDFDKLANGNDRSGKQIDGNSLAWHETSYGFLYPSLSEYRSNLRGSFAEWSEYAIVKNTTGLSIRTVGLRKPGEWRQTQEIGSTSISSDKTGGYFMFVNANNISGKVADLEVNKQICQGSIVVSAWVANAAASGSNVNLNFVVAGVDEDGSEYDIKTFTTGDIGNNGKWQQIMFKVDLDFDYPKYRIRIDNNEADANGNCFAIDDIRIYMSKPKLAGTQIMATCPNWDMSDPKAEEENIALLRVDFVNTLGKTNGTLTYTWVDSKSTATLLDFDYVGENGSNNLGKITLNGSWTQNSADVKNRYYNSVSEFLDSDKYISLGSDKSDYFFTTETSSDGDVLVLYVVHKSNKFKVNNKYYSIVTFENVDLSDAEKLQNILTECSSYATFEVMPRARIVLAGEERNSAVLQNLAVGNYPLSVRAFGMDENDKVVGYNCSADWLVVTKDMSDAEKWGYADAIMRFRREYGYEVGKEMLSNTVFPGLYSLGDNLILNQSEISANVSERGIPQSFVAVPVSETNSDNFTPCPIPLEIVLRAGVSVVLANPADTEIYENKPAVVQGSSCIIRIAEGTSSFPEMQVDFINSALLVNLSGDDLTKLGNMVLCSTDNADYTSKNHDGVFFTLESKSGTPLNELKVGDIVTVTPTDLAKKLPVGKYGFHSELLAIDSISITPAFNFDIYVVPSTVVWNPTLSNSAWHNDANWKTIDEKPAFIPLEETNVIIKANAKAVPVLPEDPTKALGAGANQYLKYDIGVDYNSCKNIYFEDGAELGRQHKLNYENAFVDIKFDKSGEGNWEMIAFPLQGVVRGDLYIPKDGDDDFNFTAATSVDNRAYNAFYFKAYDSNVKQTVVTEGKVSTEDYNYESASWSEATSALNMPIEDAHGYAVSRICNTVQDFVRLPKSATEYYLFYDMGNGNELELKADWAKYGDIDRTNSHKLVYDSSTETKEYTFTNNKGDIFLIGNPFMVNLDIKKFFEENGLTTTFYYEYVDGGLDAVMIEPNNEELRPLHAIFVKGTSTSMSFKFTPEMMLFNEQSDVNNEVPNKVAIHRVPEYIEESILTLTAEIGGVRSRTRIEEYYGANKEYNAEEDAELLVLDAALTPINLYSVASGTALAYNRVAEIEEIPISILLLDSIINAETFTLTFDGVDNFDKELYLYDIVYNTKLPLIEGLALELELPMDGEVRYYITSQRTQGGVTTDEVDVSQSQISVISTHGKAIIYSPSEIIKSVEVYDLAGRLVSIAESLNIKEYNINLPIGAYILQVTTGNNIYQEKVVVK